MSKPTPKVLSSLESYRKACADLIDFKNKTFFFKTTVVKVSHPRYDGFGLACISYKCPPDKLGVLLENMNIWWYELDTIKVSKNSKVWPRWIKQEMGLL